MTIKPIKRAIIDLRSVLWTGLLAGKDTEFGRKVQFEGKEVLVNSALHGYDNVIEHLLIVLDDLNIQPRDVIFVDEGKNSKMMRQMMYAGYKAGRERAPEIYEQFNLAKEMVLKAFLGIGAQLCWQDGMEADDVIGYVAGRLQGERYVVSNDGDLAVCISPDDGVHLWRRGAIDVNPYGPFAPEYIPVFKALVGDSSDSYPGAYKFGEAAWNKMLDTFGEDCLPIMQKFISEKTLNKLGEDVGELKELQRVIDGAEMVYTSYALARLYVEKVNTLRKPLQWRVGMVRSVSECEDERLRKWAGQVRLIHAGNYEEAMSWAKSKIEESPYVALDIETSTPEASDEWLMLQDKADRVDVFGSELTGLGMTFGKNCQYTFYLTHDHVDESDTKNLTSEQVRKFVELVPKGKVILCHNFQFEGPVLYQEWGEAWKDDPVFRGFLPEVRDTRILSSYVNENRSAGLKNLSDVVLGYQQTTYEQVTTKVVGTDDDGYDVTKKHKMNELPAKHVLAYGADDCICTAAIYNHFRVIAEIEDTYKVFEEVETFPAYLTALAFVQGADFSLGHMRELEKEDDVTYDAAWAVLRSYLLEKKWDGVVCPVYTDFEPATVKEAFEIIAGFPLKTMVRNRDKLAKAIAEFDDNPRLSILAAAVDAGDLDTMNKLVADNFDGEPKIDLSSPKQMRGLLYDVIKMPIQIINDVTDTERQKFPDLARAATKFKQWRAGSTGVTITDDDRVLLRHKAKTDDTAIAFAIAFDRDKLGDAEVAALDAVGKMKTVITRRSLFYKNYKGAPHWKDGKIHASINQCGTVTRRFSSSGPNLQQLPKKGEGVKFRECFVPHHRDAVICSVDFSGQELRLAAFRSQDKNMLSCYVGENLRDLHSITAAGAMKLKWGAQVVKGLFEKYGDASNDEYAMFLRVRKSDSEADHKMADDLRKSSKNVNFAAQFGGRAPKLSETLIMPLEDAQLFLDARNEMFPEVDKAAERSAEQCRKTGYALTLLGARRHLQAGITSNDKWEVERAARQSWNMEIQGSAAEMTKLAMKRFWLSGVIWKYDVRFIAPIHDEFMTSVGRKDALEVIKIKHDCMVEPYANMDVPILGSISLGRNFGEQKECGDWYIPENIAGALNDIFKAKEAA